MQEQQRHKPVLLDEILELSGEASIGTMLDCTLGGGGHSEASLDKNPGLFLIGIDRDEEAIEKCERRLERFAGRFEFLLGNFSELGILFAEVADNVLVDKFPGQETISFDLILADLGISSEQLDNPSRGFSFRESGPLDMRTDLSSKLDADFVVNNYELSQLIRVFKQGGMRLDASYLAKEIIKQRPISNTLELATICRDVLRRSKARKNTEKKSHDLSTVPFQAIRIEVNKEFENLRKFMDSALNYLNPEGKLVIISFHSLEDRIVANTMRAWERGDEVPRNLPVDLSNSSGVLLTKKAIEATQAEVDQNPRARSARMRVFQKACLN